MFRYKTVTDVSRHTGSTGSATMDAILTFICNTDKPAEDSVDPRKKAKFASGLDFKIVTASAGSFDNDGELIEAGYLAPSEVEIPVRWGYTFEGWFTDKDCTVPWSNDVIQSMDIYAKWDFVKMIRVNGGNYSQGTNDLSRENNERPQAIRGVSGFYMGQYQITQDQYERVMGRQPSAFNRGGSMPVCNVTWYDVVEFCNALSVYDGYAPVYTITDRTPATGYPVTNATVTADWTKNGYRLPTESEWEYAAKGGHITGVGGIDGQGTYYRYSGGDELDDIAWYVGNSSNAMHNVGMKAPNQLGIYDMTGNVIEFCWDWYAEDYYTQQLGTTTDRRGPDTGTTKVIRGGNFSDPLNLIENTNRRDFTPTQVFSRIGFRVARNAE